VRIHVDSLLAGLCAILPLVFPLAAQSQTPPPPPPNPWTQTASVGLALTSGNKDTSTLNLGFEIAYDPQTRNRIKSDGLFIRGRTDGRLTADRLGLNARDEYRLQDRAFTFGQVQYLQDQFKNIDYLVAPSMGFGYRVVDNDRTKLSLDGGLGGVWEKKLYLPTTTSGAVTLAEKLTFRVSPAATVTQAFSALYKMNNLSDSLYTFGASITSSVTSRTQVKVELLDTYKNLVTPPVVQNDVAVLVGMVFKR
jgi:putative salt-induced outer membrane protein